MICQTGNSKQSIYEHLSFFDSFVSIEIDAPSDLLNSWHGPRKIKE